MNASQTPSFREAHEKILPERLDGGLAADAARAARGLTPLALRLPDGTAFTYRPDADRIGIAAGEDAPTVVELDASDWAGLWDQHEAVFGLLLGGRARILAGDGADFTHWECALRVLYEALPAYDPTAALVDRAGRTLAPATRFHPDDDPARMAEFLEVAGYLLVREVFDAREVATLSEAAMRVAEKAREGDRDSWWSKTTAGESVLTRVLNGETEPAIAALPSDPRLLRVLGLSSFDLAPTPGAHVSVLYKRSGLVFDGKADQPWHRDCGLGGHAEMCPIMNGSVFLDPATRESGELRFLPGSWRTAGCLLEGGDFDLGVAIEAGPGDFSLHYGDGLHAGTPPTSAQGPFRRSLVFEYGPRGRTADQSQDHYDQLMHEADASGLHEPRD